MEDDVVLSRANELYWGSDLSVNQIAESLELSKSRLYGVIRPQPTGQACPICGFEADYPNRTAKDRAMVICSECGFEGVVAELEPLNGSGPPTTVPVREVLRARAPSPKTSAVLGSILLGAAAALYLINRRKHS
jgi:hypothetical protein